MPRDVRAPAIRRLVVGVVSILLPGLVLGFVGVRAAERTNSLRTTCAATALVRDRLATELTHLESDLAAGLVRQAARLDDPATASAWLRSLAAARPWLADPFLLQPDGGIVTSDLSAAWRRGGGSRAPANPLDRFPKLAAAIREAETAEFVDGRIDRALEKYVEALGTASSDTARGLVLMRIGRTLFKLRRFDEGIASYRAVLALPPEAVDPHGRPYAVNALLQIFGRVGRLEPPCREAGVSAPVAAVRRRPSMGCGGRIRLLPRARRRIGT